MPRLGKLLLQERLITQTQLEEALETQVIFGGRLGTNLCELGFLKEADLARVLGEQHNMPYAMGEMMPDPLAVKLVAQKFLDDNDMMPMRVDATRLTLAVLGPGALATIDALSFKTSRRVVTVVVPEFRMNQLLRAHVKAFRPVRPIDMNTLRPSKEVTAEEKKPQDAGDFINEDDFARLYKQASGGVAGEDDEVVIEGEVLSEETELPAMPAFVAPAAPKRPTTPLNFSEAQKVLQTSTDREDIARTVLRFAVTKWRRALILSVQGDLVTGWHGAGRGVSDKAVRRIGVSLREANTFQMVRDLRSHFIGPMKATPGMEGFYKLLGAGPPGTAVVLPLLVRGKPVHLLYLDAGPGQLTPPDVGELLIVSQSVSRSYEALIAARQAAQAS